MSGAALQVATANRRVQEWTAPASAPALAPAPASVYSLQAPVRAVSPAPVQTQARPGPDRATALLDLYLYWFMTMWVCVCFRVCVCVRLGGSFQCRNFWFAPTSQEKENVSCWNGIETRPESAYKRKRQILAHTCSRRVTRLPAPLGYIPLRPAPLSNRWPPLLYALLLVMLISFRRWRLPTTPDDSEVANDVFNWFSCCPSPIAHRPFARPPLSTGLLLVQLQHQLLPFATWQLQLAPLPFFLPLWHWQLSANCMQLIWFAIVRKEAAIWVLLPTRYQLATLPPKCVATVSFDAAQKSPI